MSASCSGGCGKPIFKLTKRKCCFLKAHVQYLGHYISGAGLEPGTGKVGESEEDASTDRCNWNSEIFRFCRIL